jgi:hypothetical protein
MRRAGPRPGADINACATGRSDGSGRAEGEATRGLGDRHDARRRRLGLPGGWHEDARLGGQDMGNGGGAAEHAAALWAAMLMLVRSLVVVAMLDGCLAAASHKARFGLRPFCLSLCDGIPVAGNGLAAAEQAGQSQQP